MSYQNDAPRTADVVFIVEQRECLNSYKLEELPKLMDRSLEERGLFNNKFSLVSFGGEGGLQVGTFFSLSNINLYFHWFFFLQEPQAYVAVDAEVFDTSAKARAAFMRCVM